MSGPGRGAKREGQDGAEQVSAGRDAWSQQHARDPRSKQLTASKQLKWRYTAFNAAGQSAIVIDTESCSRYDAALVAAHRAQRRAAHCWEHGIPCIATCDNPAKDGRGCVRVIVSACTQASLACCVH